MKASNSIVLLSTGTVGTLRAVSIDYQEPESFIGEVVRVSLHDENGNAIEAEGELEEVLA